jgi:hypothetical protein
VLGYIERRTARTSAFTSSSLIDSIRFEKSPYEVLVVSTLASRQKMIRKEVEETYGDSNENYSGTWEEPFHVKILPDGVPSPFVISIQRKLVTVRKPHDRQVRINAWHLGVKPEPLRELQIYLGVCSLYAIIK